MVTNIPNFHQVPKSDTPTASGINTVTHAKPVPMQNSDKYLISLISGDPKPYSKFAYANLIAAVADVFTTLFVSSSKYEGPNGVAVFILLLAIAVGTPILILTSLLGIFLSRKFRRIQALNVAAFLTASLIGAYLLSATRH